MFESMESNKGLHAAKRLMALLISITFHALVILLIVVLPLVFFQLMPEVDLLTFLIAAPAPPLPPPPPPPEQKTPTQGKRANPKIQFRFIDSIPDQLPFGIPVLWDEPQPVISSAGIEGFGLGMLGTGDPAGAAGIDSILHSSAPTVPPPPPPPPPRKPLLIGGKVQEAKLILKVPPVYPEIARRAHISGLVVLEVTIDEEGNVTGWKTQQGHPVLVEAAVQAVKQWKYSPTLLNGEPLQVVSTVNINFILN
jgi:protein TonB